MTNVSQNIIHNELNIFLLAKISAKRLRNNTKRFKQTGSWPRVKQSHNTLKKILPQSCLFRHGAFPRLRHGTRERSQAAIISCLTSGEACVRHRREGPRAYGSGPWASYLSSQGLALPPPLCGPGRKEGV